MRLSNKFLMHMAIPSMFCFTFLRMLASFWLTVENSLVFCATVYKFLYCVYFIRFFMLVNHSQIISSALWWLYFKFTSRHLHSKIFFIFVPYALQTHTPRGLHRWAGTRKVKPIWILLKQETVSGSGISWAICKSALCSRQITMPAPQHSVFTGQMPFLPPNQQHESTEGHYYYVLHSCKF